MNIDDETKDKVLTEMDMFMKSLLAKYDLHSCNITLNFTRNNPDHIVGGSVSGSQGDITGELFLKNIEQTVFASIIGAQYCGMPDDKIMSMLRLCMIKAKLRKHFPDDFEIEEFIRKQGD